MITITLFGVLVCVLIVCYIFIVFLTRVKRHKNSSPTPSQNAMYNPPPTLTPLQEYTIEENPFCKEQFIKWTDTNTPFMKSNRPNTFDFDFDIKKHMMDMLLVAPLGVALIDCGCHIGDGCIPIAAALKRLGRDDIRVYGIDPSKYKTDFVKKMQRENNLYNLRVLTAGLSDDTQSYTYTKTQHWGNNTGAINWTQVSGSDASTQNEIIQFTTLDTLVNTNEIKEPIYYIHLDIEGMELNALKGARTTLQKYHPILSIEEHDTNDHQIRDFLLPFGYRYQERINSNNVYIAHT